MKKQIILLLCLVGYIQILFAETHISVQNNTDTHFRFGITQHSGPSLSQGDEYNKHANNIYAYERDEKVASYNRNVGVKNGKTYIMLNQLRPYFNSNEVIEMKVKLTGTWNHSDISAGFNIASPRNNFWSGLWTDRNTHTRSFFLSDGIEYRITMRFIYTGGDDDIVYVIDYANQSQFVKNSDYSNPNILNVAAWNIWQLPGIAQILNARNQYVDDWLAPYEVLVVSEAFDNSNRESLKKALKERGFNHFTTVVDNPNNSKQDGGVFIASRYTIEKSEQELFDNLAANGDDQANKGAMYAKINKLGKIYHVIGSHTQSGSSYSSTRTSNLKEIYNLMNRQGILRNHTDPVIYAGDLNVNRYDSSGNLSSSEYVQMLKTLNSRDPQLEGNYQTTYDVDDNYWNNSGKDEILDYVLFSKEHQEPVLATKRIFVPRHTMLNHPSLNWNDIWRRVITDISDHYGVHARFVFPESRFKSTQENGFNNTQKITAYPNPATNHINLILPQNLKTGGMTIINTVGQIQYSSEIDTTKEEQQVDISNYAKGIYIIQLQGENGRIETTKFTIK